MATSSQVKAGLDDIATAIRAAREQMIGVQGMASSVSANLAGLATDYADVAATIQAYGTTNSFEALAKAEMAKLLAEYTALKGHADTVVALDLSNGV